MDRREFLRLSSLVAPASLAFANPAAAQLAGGIDELTREAGFALELPVSKAVAVVGALLHIAREKLPSLEFAEITKFLPGAERLIFQAANVVAGPLPKSLDGMPAILEKIALPEDTTVRIRDFVFEYLGNNGGRKAVGLLRKAWR